MKVSTDVSLSPKTILLVEDQAIIALREKQVLEQNGYTVVVVHTGEKAVAAARSQPEISLILMDIDLGDGIDGSEAAEQILGHRDVPIVFLSGHTEPEIVEKTEGITSYGYIVKNSGTTVLLASIRMAFRLYDARTAARNTARMMAVILEVSRRLVSTLDLQTIVQTASDRLSELSGLDTGALYLVDHAEIIMAAATPDIPPDFPQEYQRAPLDAHPHIGAAIAQQEPVVVDDTRNETWTPAEQGVVDARNLASIMYVPLVSQERAIGVYITGATDRGFLIDSQAVDLCVTLANIAAGAIENATAVTAAGTPNPRPR